jgi:hypothetical protein
MPKFDCVVFSHVLEHVLEIPAFFEAACKLLAPGGYLYLETPDATRYKDYLYAPFQEFNTEHINHFSPRSLKNAARRFGFQPVLVERKVIQTAEDTLYPAAFGLFRDMGATTEERPPVCDEELPAAISIYIQRSAEQMQRIDDHLARALAGKQQVILWGAGQLTMKLLGLPSLAQVEVQAIVDNNPTLRNKKLRGAPIVGPKEIPMNGESTPLIIGTLLHADEIMAQIRRMGLRNPVLSLLPNLTPEAKLR